MPTRRDFLQGTLLATAAALAGCGVATRNMCEGDDCDNNGGAFEAPSDGNDPNNGAGNQCNNDPFCSAGTTVMTVRLTNAHVGMTYHKVFDTEAAEQRLVTAPSDGLLTIHLAGNDPSERDDTTDRIVTTADVGQQMTFSIADPGDFGFVAGGGETPAMLHSSLKPQGGYAVLDREDMIIIVIEPNGTVWRSDENSGVDWDFKLHAGETVVLVPQPGAQLAEAA